MLNNTQVIYCHFTIIIIIIIIVIVIIIIIKTLTF